MGKIIQGGGYLKENIYAPQTDLIGDCVDRVIVGICECNPGRLGDLCTICGYKEAHSLCRAIMVIENIFVERRANPRIP